MRNEAVAEESRGIARMAVAVALASLLLTLLVNLPFLSSYAVRGDDFALLSHSARSFSPSPLEWVTQGYRGYNTTFPELGEEQTNFIRPTVNASVYLDSWLSPSPGSVIMLTSNYLGHAVATALVFVLAVQIFGLSPGAGVLAASLFLASSATSGLLTAVAYRGDMLAGLLALGALLLTNSYVSVRAATWKLIATAAFLLLAMFAKEAAVAAPAVIGIFVWTQRTNVRGGLVKVAVALAVPLAAYAAVRLQAGLGGNYALEGLPNRVFGVPRFALNPLRFAVTAFLIPETEVLKAALSGSAGNLATVIGLARAVISVASNVAVGVLLVMLCRRPPERARLLPLLALGVMASALPIVINADPRFMYFGQALLLPLLVLVLVRARERWLAGGRGRMISNAAIAVLIGVGPLYFVLQSLLAQPALVKDNQTAAALERAVVAELARPTLRRLYLVNAVPVLSPGKPALEFLASRSGRDDVALRVVNTFGDSGGQAGAPDARSVQFSVEDGVLKGTVGVGRSQYLFGAGMLTPQTASRLGQPGVIAYGPITEFSRTAWGTWQVDQDEITFSIPGAQRRDYAVLGLDPAEPGVHILHQPGLTWRSAAANLST